MAYCKNQRALQDCFFIGDVGSIAIVDSARRTGAQPDDVIHIADVTTFASPAGFGGTPIDRSVGDFGAVYYPWILANDPIGSGANPRILLPPSPYVAGIYARIDNSRGVFTAPAGTQAMTSSLPLS